MESGRREDVTEEQEGNGRGRKGRREDMTEEQEGKEKGEREEGRGSRQGR